MKQIKSMTERHRAAVVRSVLVGLGMVFFLSGFIPGCVETQPEFGPEQRLRIETLIFQQRSTGDSEAEAVYENIETLVADQAELIDLQVILVLQQPQIANLGELTLRSNIEGDVTTLGADDAAALRTLDSQTDGAIRKQYTFSYQFTIGQDPSRVLPTIDFAVAAKATTTVEGYETISTTSSGFLPVDMSRSSQTPSMAAPSIISAGSAHSAAVDSSGQAWLWGNNEDKQIDNLNLRPVTVPFAIEMPQPVSSISAGFRHTLAVTTDNRVYGWGTGFSETATAPTLVGEIDNAVAAIAGNDASYVISTSGELYAWGENDSGVLGLSGATFDTPTLIPIGPVTKIAVGEKHVIALAPDGSVWGWGESQYGRLGDSYRSSVSAIRLPEKIADVANIVDIAATGETSFLVSESGRALLFGRDHTLAEIGGPRDMESNFKYVEGVFDAIGVVANGYNNSVIFTRRASNNSTYYSVYGINEFGQLTIASPTQGAELPDANFPDSPTALVLGTQHGLFLQDVGGCTAVWSWGTNADGRLGRAVGVGEQQHEPHPIEGLGDGSCAILTTATDNGGSIASTPGNISCGVNCAAALATGDSVSLDANQQAGNFTSFEGDCTLADGSPNTALPMSIMMDTHKYCPASFRTPSGNVAPVARMTLSPTSPVELGTEVTYDGTASSDDDGTIVSWDWDLDGDTLIDASGEIITFTYGTAGYRAITLTVTDNDGLTGSANGVVDVMSGLSAPPVAAFTILPSASEILGTTFSFDAAPSSDDVGIAGLSWDFNNDGSFEASGLIATYAPSATGDYEIRLRVTDTDGQFTDLTQTITVLPPPTAIQHTLRLVITGPGQVDIPGFAGPLPDSNCDGNECFVRVDEGTVLTVDASPSTGSSFTGWSITECDTVPSPNRCVVTMNAERTVTAAFQ